MSKTLRALLFALPFLLLTSIIGLAQEKTPQIQFDDKDHNWGTIYEGEKATHIFSFTNTGEADLVIDKVNSSCGCTAALVSEKIIAPGAKGEIKATFDSTRRPGKQTKTITVQSNDPNESSVRLTITGIVENYIEVKPDPLNLGTVFRGDAVTQTVRIVPPKIRPNMKITNVESNQAYLKVEMESPGNWGQKFASKMKNLFKKNETTEEEEGIPITISLSPEAPVGRIRASIKIDTDDERKPTLNLRVVGTVTGPIQVVPQTIAFSPASEGQPNSKKVTITSRVNGFEIIKVENNSPHILVDTIEKVKGKSYELEVKLSEATPKGQIRENLVIHTNNKDQSVINIPVYGFIQ